MARQRFDSILRHLLMGRTLPSQEWKRLFLNLLQNRLGADEAKRLLVAIARKGEGIQEILGCVQALRKLEPPVPVKLPFLMDLCGTGGDGKGTFNISTVSSFVTAGAGAYVAKHGNRAVSSKCGSSDLMEALGIRIEAPPRRMLQALKRFRLGYFHAPCYHPIFAKIQPLRQSLGIRTIFNCVGPLLNPVRLDYQMIGVSNAKWFEPMAHVLAESGCKKGAVIRSVDGLDELSSTSPNEILCVEKGRIRKIRLDPKSLGFKGRGGKRLPGGDLRANKEIALGILEGRLTGPECDVVLLNSGFALWLTGLSCHPEEGIQLARFSIRSGRALEVLKGLQKFTTERRSG